MWQSQFNYQWTPNVVEAIDFCAKTGGELNDSWIEEIFAGKTIIIEGKKFSLEQKLERKIQFPNQAQVFTNRPPTVLSKYKTRKNTWKTNPWADRTLAPKDVGCPGRRVTAPQEEQQVLKHPLCERLIQFHKQNFSNLFFTSVFVVVVHFWKGHFFGFSKEKGCGFWSL